MMFVIPQKMLIYELANITVPDYCFSRSSLIWDYTFRPESKTVFTGQCSNVFFYHEMVDLSAYNLSGNMRKAAF